MPIGTTMAALAVLLVVSEMITAMTTTRIAMVSSLDTFSVSDRPSPIFLASPVFDIRLPSAIPEPNSRIVPQSIRAASFQFRVKRRSGQESGRTNSRPAASTATTPSSRKELTSA